MLRKPHRRLAAKRWQKFLTLSESLIMKIIVLMSFGILYLFLRFQARKSRSLFKNAKEKLKRNSLHINVDLNEVEILSNSWVEEIEDGSYREEESFIAAFNK